MLREPWREWIPDHLSGLFPLALPCFQPHPFFLHNPTAGPNMAPFLRIAFNSYELGSLEATDEANPPFCAVKMKEALSTGRAGG